MPRFWEGPRLWEGLLWLSGFGTVGLAAELALSRHWKSLNQVIAWVALALLVLAWASLARARRSEWGSAVDKRRLAARIAVLVAFSSLVGIWQHVAGNYEAGPLDAVFGGKWDGMTEAARWWAAITMRVGPSPTLAPGALALLAGMVWLLAAAGREG